MNVAWRMKSGEEGVMQVGKGEVALTNMEFKKKNHTCGKYGNTQNKCPQKNKSEDEKGYKIFLGKCNHCSKVGKRLKTAGNLRLIKTRGLRIGRRKKIER